MGSGLWNSGFGLRALISGFGLQTLVYKLWSTDFGLRTLVYGLWSMDFDLWTLVYGLCTTDFGLRTLKFDLLTLVFEIRALVFCPHLYASTFQPMSGIWSLCIDYERWTDSKLGVGVEQALNSGQPGRDEGARRRFLTH